HPRPKVDAEVLAFAPRATRLFADEDERDMLETVRASFFAPRKTIRNALIHSLGIDGAKIVRALERASIDPTVRAEKLSVPDFLRLAHSLRIELAGRIVARNA
ncbi:MAG TPA: rRNA adenine N-6-methyltransferase family protein, partial [Candidatus Binatus sp.]|nr:rRNA adenine N-6-methyltransferase family protein [Candidatus Binatus sp.]